MNAVSEEQAVACYI